MGSEDCLRNQRANFTEVSRVESPAFIPEKPAMIGPRYR